MLLACFFIPFQVQQAVFSLFKKLKPNILVTDIKIPNVNGIELTRLIAKDDKK
jgi:YesN/AraC family two-component response regulator